MSTSNISLSHSTSRTVEGPVIRLQNNRLVFEYDCQADDGSIEWVEVVFGEVLAIEYMQGACGTGDSVVGSHEIRVANLSSWLAEVLSRWQESVGWQQWHREQGGAARFKHFTIDFDDVGAVDVIASSCDVTPVG